MTSNGQTFGIFIYYLSSIAMRTSSTDDIPSQLKLLLALKHINSINGITMVTISSNNQMNGLTIFFLKLKSVTVVIFKGVYSFVSEITFGKVNLAKNGGFDMSLRKN